ncbi:hypothetical protein [Nocardioides sp. SLBN-35]|uniref:hypothetical protein n=1 Tax=Nocardioides sp. SLBN-35 TaxID=2768445 RepID=UPI0011519563|nr:hypothetical protein [Nocardioides sp. SLBN-35]TQK69314.1 hypothetical protein FBY23_1076 [Nocardioides sp. SLBN-35]
MPSRRRPAMALALGAATLLLLTGIAPAVADDPAVPTDGPSATAAEATAEPTPEATPETTPDAVPTPEAAPEPTPAPESAPTPSPTPDPTPDPKPAEGRAEPAAPAAVDPTGISLTPSPAELAAGDQVGFTVWAVDGSGQHLHDVSAEAELEFVGGAGTCTATTCTTTTAGYFVIKATWGGFTSITGLQVSPGEPAGIALTPAATTIGTGRLTTLSAMLSDRHGNPISPADLVDFSADTGLTCDDDASTTTCTSTTPGSYTVTAALRSDPTRTASATITVEESTEVLTALDVDAPASIVAGETLTLVARAQTAGSTVVDVTDRATFTVVRLTETGAADGSGRVPCPGGSCILTAAGRYSVFATLDDLVMNEPVRVEVVPAAPVGLILSPATAAVTVGASQAFEAATVDTFGNHGPAAGATYDIDAPGTCTANACTSATPGTYTVTAALDGWTATATLQVHADAHPSEGIARIEVAATAPSVEAGTPATFVVHAYDAEDRPIGTVTDDATLEIAGAGSWTTPAGERTLACSADTCTSTVAGEHTVTAHLGDLSATTTMIVVPGPLARSGLGPSNAVIRAGETQDFVAGIMDRYGNIAEATPTPYAIDLEASAGASCTGQTCGSTRPGVYVIRVRAVDGTDIEAGPSWLFVGILTVIPGLPHHLGIEPPSTTVPVGTPVDLTATVYDEYDNPIDDVTAETTFVAPAGATCAANRCSSTVAASYDVTGSRDGLSDVASLRFTPGPVDRVVLSPRTATVTAGQTQAFRAAGVDAYDNEVGDVTDATTFTVTAPGSCTANRCGSAQAAELTVTGSYVVPTPRRCSCTGLFAVLAAPGDTVIATATLSVTAAPGSGPGTGDPGAGVPQAGGGAGGGNGGGADGGQDGQDGGQGAGAGDAGALPATGSAVAGWQGVLGLLLLAGGLLCARGGRTRRRA